MELDLHSNRRKTAKYFTEPGESEPTSEAMQRLAITAPPQPLPSNRRQSSASSSSVSSRTTQIQSSAFQYSTPSQNQHDSDTTQILYSPDTGNEIYERHLELKKRGFPLWIPEPNLRLPNAYKRIGIRIGDVGLITPSGAFSFLFNVCESRDHPINPRILPEGFASIAHERTDISAYPEFTPGSFLASATIEKIQNDPPFRQVIFFHIS